MVEMPKSGNFRQMTEIEDRVDEARPEVQPAGPEAPPAERDAPQAASPAALPARRRTVKRAMIATALLAATVGAGYYGHYYWTTGRYLESTDDAYMQADYTTVAPKVSGYISEVLVRDNQPVEAGQVLARIDDRDLRTALSAARANVDATQAAIRNLNAKIVLQHSVIAQAMATVASAKASLEFARTDAERYGKLAEDGANSVRKAQASSALAEETSAELARAEAAAAAAKAKVSVLVTARGQAVAEADRALAAEEQARLDLSYATIAAPVSGTVGARSLRVGQYVTAGTELMAVVPLHAVFVVGNFKETQITDVRAGQPATVRVDGFPGVTLAGRVDSLAPASGLEFSLLPPDNATGNFTKVVQRVPVKIAIDEGRLKGLLRPGMSVEPTVDTRGARAAGLSAPGR